LISGVQVNDGVANKLEDLPSGFGDFGYESGLIKHMKPVIKCKIDDNGNGSLEKTVYTGKDGIYGAQTSIESEVDYNNLESEIPGFKFVNGPCDPCKSINGSPEYSCPFRLDVEKVEPGISSVWQYLWNINDNPLQSIPSFLSESINPNKFPLLSELQSELKKQGRPTE
jgi:hypothetical protein